MTISVHPAEHDETAGRRQPIENGALWRAFAHIVVAFALLTGCASDVSTQLSDRIVVAPSMPAAWPSPATAAPDAPPAIQKIWVSTLHLTAGGGFEGAVVTSTNVASVEIRTAVFSINAPRSTFGRFAFKLHILEFPPMLKHTYPMQIIARNAAGVESTEDAYLVLE